MSMIDRMERRFGWLAFPGFLRFYAILHALVFVLQLFRPDIGIMLEFDRAAILSGEVWRVVTFLFASSGYGGFGPVVMIFFFFMVMIAFMMSDALEGAWGVFRTTLFYYVGIIGLLIGNFIISDDFLGSGYYIYLAAFFSFATLFPRVEFMLFFIIPVQVRWLAIFLGAVMMLGAGAQFLGGDWLTPVFYVLAFGNYVLWAGLPALKGKARAAQAVQRRRKFESAKPSPDEAFHKCETCSRTDQSHPQLEFRISSDGKEYCLDHLPKEED